MEDSIHMRTCIFCGDPASSKEDAWPLWLLRRIGASGPGEMSAERGRAGVFRWHQAKAGLPIRCVCRSCNNGWMSRLESQAKPVIEQLLGDDPVTLNLDDQKILAAWAIKCVMVCEGLRLEQSWAFTQEERAQLRESLALPSRARVWIAKCVNSPGLYCSARDLTGRADGLGFRVSAYVATMAFGPLAIQVLNFSLPNLVPSPGEITADLVDGPWDSLALQIWPDSCPRLPWPADMGLAGEEGLDVFSKRWKVQLQQC